MSTENTNTPSPATSTSENTSAASTGDPVSLMTNETPSSSVDIQQPGDFASWLNDKLDSFEKGQETAPWDKKEENSEQSEVAESEEQTEPSSEEETQEKEVESEDSEDKETEEEIKTMSGSAGAKFKELKGELKSYKAKVAEMEKMLAERQNSNFEEQSSPQLEELQARVAEYEREIAVARIEASPQYKQAVLEPTQAILDTAITLAEKYEVAPKKLVNALREESSGDASDALMELASDFSERDRVRLYRMADDLAEVSNRREYLKQNAAQAMAEMAERQQAEEAQFEKQYKEQVFQTANSTWDETFANNPIIQSLGDNVVKELQQASSEADLVDAGLEERAYAVYAGVALPHIVKKYAEISEKLAEAEKALGKYKKASPKVSGNVDTSPQKQEIGGFLDAIEKRFTLG